jgi:hypothetical protein
MPVVDKRHKLVCRPKSHFKYWVVWQSKCNLTCILLVVRIISKKCCVSTSTSPVSTCVSRRCLFRIRIGLDSPAQSAYLNTIWGKPQTNRQELRFLIGKDPRLYLYARHGRWYDTPANDADTLQKPAAHPRITGIPQPYIAGYRHEGF